MNSIRRRVSAVVYPVSTAVTRWWCYSALRHLLTGPGTRRLIEAKVRAGRADRGPGRCPQLSGHDRALAGPRAAAALVNAGPAQNRLVISAAPGPKDSGDSSSSRISPRPGRPTPFWPAWSRPWDLSLSTQPISKLGHLIDSATLQLVPAGDSILVVLLILPVHS